MRRRSRETAYPCDTWSGQQFQRLVTIFGFCCAYCGVRADEPLQPDHVIPLSFGGRNRIANLLPACAQCNADKRDLPLAKWNGDRARRGLTPRVTSWDEDDSRFFHLLDVPRHPRHPPLPTPISA